MCQGTDWSLDWAMACCLFRANPFPHPLPMNHKTLIHYCDVIMGAMVSQTTSLTIVYLNLHLGADQRKYQSSASLAFMRGTHRSPVNLPHKWPVTRKLFPFDDVIMNTIKFQALKYTIKMSNLNYRPFVWSFMCLLEADLLNTLKTSVKC